MNTNEIYRNALKLPTEKDLKEEATISKEEMDWQVWRNYPQTIEFIRRLRFAQRNADSATKLNAINGDEKLLRAVAVESLTLEKVLNLTNKGTYANPNQS